MRIPAPQIQPGDIVVKDRIPTLAVGKEVIATVLSNAKNGLVLVSMFGKRLIVETTLDLKKDQILNLKVISTAPKVIMKTVDTGGESRAAFKIIENLAEQLTAKFGNAPIESFELREVLKKLIAESPDEATAAQLANNLIREFSLLPPNTLAYLLIPLIDEDARGSARVAIERDGQDYRLHFNVATDALGLIESTVLRTKGGVAVEISSGDEEIVAFLKMHMRELAIALEPFEVRGIEVVQKRPSPMQRAGVDVVV